ncbi:hypothetical protein ACWC3X_20785 [Streptomyces populi]
MSGPPGVADRPDGIRAGRRLRAGRAWDAAASGVRSPLAVTGYGTGQSTPYGPRFGACNSCDVDR